MKSIIFSSLTNTVMVNHYVEDGTNRMSLLFFPMKGAILKWSGSPTYLVRWWKRANTFSGCPVQVFLVSSTFTDTVNKHQRHRHVKSSYGLGTRITVSHGNVCVCVGGGGGGWYLPSAPTLAVSQSEGAWVRRDLPVWGCRCWGDPPSRVRGRGERDFLSPTEKEDRVWRGTCRLQEWRDSGWWRLAISKSERTGVRKGLLSPRVRGRGWRSGLDLLSARGHNPLNMHEHSPRLFLGGGWGGAGVEYSLYIRVKLT